MQTEKNMKSILIAFLTASLFCHGDMLKCKVCNEDPYFKCFSHQPEGEIYCPGSCVTKTVLKEGSSWAQKKYCQEKRMSTVCTKFFRNHVIHSMHMRT